MAESLQAGIDLRLTADSGRALACRGGFTVVEVLVVVTIMVVPTFLLPYLHFVWGIPATTVFTVTPLALVLAFLAGVTWKDWQRARTSTSPGEPVPLIRILGGFFGLVVVVTLIYFIGLETGMGVFGKHQRTGEGPLSLLATLGAVGALFAVFHLMVRSSWRPTRFGTIFDLACLGLALLIIAAGLLGNRFLAGVYVIDLPTMDAIRAGQSIIPSPNPWDQFPIRKALFVVTGLWWFLSITAIWPLRQMGRPAAPTIWYAVVFPVLFAIGNLFPTVIHRWNGAFLIPFGVGYLFLAWRGCARFRFGKGGHAMENPPALDAG
jgi:hypothetical protein